MFLDRPKGAIILIMLLKDFLMQDECTSYFKSVVNMTPSMRRMQDAFIIAFTIVTFKSISNDSFFQETGGMNIV